MSNKKFNVIEEAKLFNIYKELYEKILDLLKKYDEPQLIASTLLGQGFRLYKGVLNDKEFNDLIKHIVKTAKTITPLTKNKTIN